MTKTFSPGMNESLWKDSDSYSVFSGVYLQLIHHLTIAEDYEVSLLLSYANQLDDLMQEYEDKYGSIEDPQFYWAFATANAYFLFQGGKDEIGANRGQYVINSYMAALEKHALYPSLSADCIDEALGNMASFVNEDGKRWISENRNKYTPLPWGHELLDQKNDRDENMQYTVGDFMNSDNVYISSAAQNMPLYPLSLSDAKIFFNYFKDELFDFDGIAKTIDIRSAKYNLPRSSWADGFLYSQTLDELDLIVDKCSQLPNFVGHIHFAYGGHKTSPVIRVKNLSYLFWNNGKLQVPPCCRCGSSLTIEHHEFLNDIVQIYIECMECGNRELQGNFKHGSGNNYVKL